MSSQRGALPYTEDPLFLAVKNGDVNQLQQLLANSGGQSLVLRTESNSALLHVAAAEGHAAMVQELLDRGASVNDRNRHGETPLYHAARYGALACARLLLQQPGCCVNARSSCNETPLGYAAHYGHVEMARLLLEHRADTNLCVSGNWSPLTWASRHEEFEIARLLIEYGATNETRMNAAAKSFNPKMRELIQTTCTHKRP